MIEHPRISINPGICGGKPCVAGTRMRVCDILYLLACGVGEDEILADFEYVTLDDIRASLAYAAGLARHKELISLPL